MDSLEHPPVSHLICPRVRTKYYSDEKLPREISGGNLYRLINNSYYDDNSSYDRHRLYLKYRCNNKEYSKDCWLWDCWACQCRTISTTYYFCEVCDKPYHKECVESPPQIKSLYHPKHRLQLVTQYAGGNSYCKYCGSYCPRDGSYFLYHCFSCKFNLDPVCARKPPVLDYKKRHEHTLHYFPRQTDLVCDVCGVVEISSKPLIFVCLECDFVVHKNCVYLPFVIRISRHDHRISFTYSSPYKNLLCGVCRTTIDKDYGNYVCTKGCIYAAHTRCATRSDVWDGKELEGEPEYEEHKNVSSFELIGDGIIHHFSHSHHLRLEREAADILYDDRIRCQACTLALNNDGCDVYKCMNSNCDFVLHEECANLPRVKQHIAHPSPLILRVSHTNRHFICEFCNRFSFGFRYVYTNRLGRLRSVDVRCATISEPFDHQCHIHPLFLTSERWRYRLCSMCGDNRDQRRLALNCIECDFILCFACATLPYKARYKHDEHILTLSYVENVRLSWCEICEEGLCKYNESGLWLYACNVCEVTLHIACLLGKDAIYIKPAQNISLYGKIVSIVPNSGLTRPFCDWCKNRCKDKTMFVKPDGRIFCKSSEL